MENILTELNNNIKILVDGALKSINLTEMKNLITKEDKEKKLIDYLINLKKCEKEQEIMRELGKKIDDRIHEVSKRLDNSIFDDNDCNILIKYVEKSPDYLRSVYFHLIKILSSKQGSDYQEQKDEDSKPVEYRIKEFKKFKEFEIYQEVFIFFNEIYSNTLL